MCIYPKIQEEVFQQIQSVAGTGTDPVSHIAQAFHVHISLMTLQIFADQAKLDKVMAIFYEAGRLFRTWRLLCSGLPNVLLTAHCRSFVCSCWMGDDSASCERYHS